MGTKNTLEQADQLMPTDANCESEKIFYTRSIHKPFVYPKFDREKGSVPSAAEVTGSPCMICPEGTWSPKGLELCKR